MRYRVTLPDRYPPRSPGGYDVTARQGYYCRAATPVAAAHKIRARLADAGRVESVLTVEAADGYPVTVILDYAHPGDVVALRRGVR